MKDNLRLLNLKAGFSFEGTKYIARLHHIILQCTMVLFLIISLCVCVCVKVFIFIGKIQYSQHSIYLKNTANVTVWYWKHIQNHLGNSFVIKTLCDQVCLTYILIVMSISAIFICLQNCLAPLLHFSLK